MKLSGPPWGFFNYDGSGKDRPASFSGLRMNIVNFPDGTGTRHCRRGLTLPRASALGVAAALIALSLLFLLDMHALGQTKQQPTPRTPQDAHTWHREVIKDEIDGDGVAYYLSTLEE